MRLAVLWPRPRKDRWRRGQSSPDRYPDQSDALLYLEKQGFEVTIEESLGLPWNPLVRQHEFYSGLDPLRALRVAWRARRYDAIVCIGDATAFFLLWLRDRLGISLPVVSIDPALSTDYPRRKRLQDRVLPRVQKVIVYGQSQLEYLAEQYGGRVNATFLRHRADTEFYCPGSEEADVGPKGPYVLSIGNDYSRDFETVVRAAELCAATPGFTHRFRIHTTRQVIPSPAVEMTRDGLEFVELRELYRRASVVIISLRDMIHAGGINSLLEAMAVGRPVVVSGSRGIRDYVTDGQTALVVRPGDSVAMAGAVQRLVTYPDEARRLGRLAREFLVETCSLEAYARSLGEVLREVIRDNRQPAGGRPSSPERVPVDDAKRSSSLLVDKMDSPDVGQEPLPTEPHRI